MSPKSLFRSRSALGEHPKIYRDLLVQFFSLLKGFCPAKPSITGITNSHLGDQPGSEASQKVLNPKRLMVDTTLAGMGLGSYEGRTASSSEPLDHGPLFLGSETSGQNQADFWAFSGRRSADLSLLKGIWHSGENRNRG